MLFRNCGDVLLILFGSLLFSCNLFGGQEPLPQPENVKPNSPQWLKVDVKDARFTSVLKHMELIKGAPRKKNSDWLFRSKWWNYSSTGNGVWLPDQKKVFFINGHSGRAWFYDASAFGSWGGLIQKKKTPKGWTKVAAGGAKLPGHVRWASACYDPVNGEVVLFGGNANTMKGGSVGTMVFNLAKNEWRRLDFGPKPLVDAFDRTRVLNKKAQALVSRMRARWHQAQTAEESKSDLIELAVALGDEITQCIKTLPEKREESSWAKVELDKALTVLSSVLSSVSSENIKKVTLVAEHLRAAQAWLAVEPSPRALTSMVYLPASKKIVLFGGDHLDYLLSDTWLYDCPTRTWQQKRPALAPAPRGGHALVAMPGTTQVVMLGGFAYGSEEGYGAADYWYRSFDLWSYDVSKNAWHMLGMWPLRKKKIRTGSLVMGGPTSPRSSSLKAAVSTDQTIVCFSNDRFREGKKAWWGSVPYACRVNLKDVDVQGTATYGVRAGTVTRRTGKYVPTWWDGEEPIDNGGIEAKLKNISPNTWVALSPPKILGRNRDWGTATFDTDRGQVLYFSGGHCAYSGTDVSMYSTKANRWRISDVGEMPLQFCRGTGYHGQAWSFSGRPWMTSHTYKMYAYDPVIKKMVLSNRNHTHIFDPRTAEWEWPPKPSPFGIGFNPKYCTSPKGVYVWATPNKKSTLRSSPKSIGSLYHFNSKLMDWEVVKTGTAVVPGVPFADSGTLVYDVKRDRLLLFASNRKSGKQSGWSCQLATGEFKSLALPESKFGPSFPRESIYLPKGDLVLFAHTISVVNEKTVVVSVYDAKGNRFRGLTLGVPKFNPKGKGVGYGGHSTGLMYDPVRGLAWTVNAAWKVRVMRFDSGSAQFVDE